MIELLRDVLAERVAGASGRNAPTTPIVWVRPEQVADWALVRSLLNPIELPNLVQSVDTWREAAVEAEDGVVDDSRQRQVVEQLGELLPNVRVSILAQAFVVEAVHLGDLARLVVASQDRDSVPVADLERDKQSDSLDTIIAAVDIITHEQVVRVRRLTTDLEEFKEIVELAVDVAADSHRHAHLLHVRLVDQDLLRLVAEGYNLGLGERLASEKNFNLLVKVRDIVKVDGLIRLYHLLTTYLLFSND